MNRVDVGREECWAALRVAARAQRQTSLAPVDYEVWLRGVQQRNAARYRHGGRRRLPTSFQIARAFGGWDAALVEAGLEPRPAPGFPEARRGVSIIEILEWGLELYGALANTRQSELLARTQKIPYPRRDRPWTAYVDELRRSRTRRGLWTPPSALPLKLAPNFAELAPGQTESLGTLLGLRRLAVGGGWTREECVEAFIRFLDDLPRGWSASLDHYQEWTAVRPDEPWSHSFDRYGGFAAIREEARRERRRRLLRERDERAGVEGQSVAGAARTPR